MVVVNNSISEKARSIMYIWTRRNTLGEQYMEPIENLQITESDHPENLIDEDFMAKNLVFEIRATNLSLENVNQEPTDDTFSEQHEIPEENIWLSDMF